MAFEGTFSLEIIEEMENFLIWKRPEPEIRHLLDLGYRIENQDVFVFEIHPRWVLLRCSTNTIWPNAPMFKRHVWKVFWLRASGKWDPYPPAPRVNSIRSFLDLVEEDRHHCFFG